MNVRELKSFLILVVASVGLTNDSLAYESAIYYYSRIDGRQFVTSPQRPWIQTSPDWTPGEPLPISIKTVLAAARKELERYTTAKEPGVWFLSAYDIIRFRDVDAPKWYFVVEFKRLTQELSTVSAHIPVNMKGEVSSLGEMKTTPEGKQSKKRH